ncbi:MAG: Asp-tRNA(Asn)/Glu-tRNA(Gln) amidotransferase subunit GatB [Anaerolineae bacterium]|nr:Asp-tRNA(Asn)/Glu-tRNA(Gln) amidotransferase subunit GatB [Anaerolineae bacterium]
MSKVYEPVIGLEVHAVLETASKMFCDCPVVDSTHGHPNRAVCPVCSGMPGVLPVINRKAVEYALRVALALDCQVAATSIFARKSYFYPDLPKGYQISQYEQPLARGGRLAISVGGEEQVIRIRRVHIEEDTGKLTHFNSEDGVYSLVDLNRSGIPLLEIVSQPDMHSVEAVRAYAVGLRSLMRYLGVNSGDLEKGLFRIEPNISLRPIGNRELGTRTEIKNLNSFRSLERAISYEIERQSELLNRGEPVVQETVGWDETNERTVSQRSKEDAEDYRYFPEPDLPPLLVETDWIEAVRASLPELPYQRQQRYMQEFSLNAYDAGVLVAEKTVADFFEAVLESEPSLSPKMAANWISGDLFGLLNQMDREFDDLDTTPKAFAKLLSLIAAEEINQNTAKNVLAEMLASGAGAEEIVDKHGWKQLSDEEAIAEKVAEVLLNNPSQVDEYLAGKQALSGWLFGQVMQASGGMANPRIVRRELEKRLDALKKGT